MKLQSAVMTVLGFSVGILVSLIVFEVDSLNPDKTNETKPTMTNVQASYPVRLVQPSMRDMEIRRELGQIQNDLREKRLGRDTVISNLTSTARSTTTLIHSYAGVTRSHAKPATTNRLIRPRRRTMTAQSYLLLATNDCLIETATFLTMDPINPKPGMVFSAYNEYANYMDWDALKKCDTTLPKMPALVTCIDNGSDFSLALAKGLDAKMGRWEGFLKSKRTVTCTITLQRQNADVDSTDGYVLYVNGKLCGSGARVSACDVNLKADWNKVEIACQYYRDVPLIMSFKPKGSPADPKPLTPAMMFYDDKPVPEI